MTRVFVGVGAHVDTAFWAKVTAIIAALAATVSADTMIETSGGTATGGTFGVEGRGLDTRGGDASDVGTRVRGHAFIQRSAVRIGDGDGEGGETVDTTMSPFSTTVAGTMEVGPNASLGQTMDGSRGIRWTSAGTKGQKMGQRR